MNKLLVILLAICLFSVHAFVKRDAPADKPVDLQGVAKDFQDKLSEFGKQIETTFDPEKIKKGVNDLIDGFNKALKENKAA